ncbi:MAG: 7-cyano-7-deazaguanine/7-aminomethyl-7-deazaguanine transporter [Succinivibrio sp.]|jgi:hypothetical protein|nr:7-cyano-7-deazaguanine/7-aminomethyl-7-deazaguanine transporter [Succinivibrio sp.]
MQKFSFPLKKLWFTHILILVLSNYAVQIPLTIFGINTTVGTFTYPFVFLSTDLTVRIFGQEKARIIVLLAVLPGLVLSYLVGTLFEHGQFQSFEALTNFSMFVFRIVAASLCAYAVGQLCDIFVFQKLREQKSWWTAPMASSVLGNFIDTYIFFGVAFCACSDVFMAEHWMGIALVDYLVKIAANLIIFLPIYGIILNFLLSRVYAVKVTEQK